ncbi:hypothetical protein Patl1_23779 [Pistacia atlantica]|uniref:Uncharacterized protein n=1 Tax=Pistacia atlantica TaxID=434234 RepID=A0ACC1A2V4_9ROSI|nr:hypothetical protein Patl1_23779 [Pistacia atlantica]
MIEIMRAKGSHKYKTPHVRKAMLESEGQLATQMRCEPVLV